MQQIGNLKEKWRKLTIDLGNVKGIEKGEFGLDLGMDLRCILVNIGSVLPRWMVRPKGKGKGKNKRKWVCV